jgi:hypothetical protein
MKVCEEVHVKEFSNIPSSYHEEKNFEIFDIQLTLIGVIL